MKPSSDPSSPSTPTPLPAVPSPIYAQYDALGQFFGEHPPVPPPYEERYVEPLPRYPGHPDDEPPTLARYMFKYGFGWFPTLIKLNWTHRSNSVLPVLGAGESDHLHPAHAHARVGVGQIGGGKAARDPEHATSRA
jgi:hypothetical protein